MTHAGSQDLSEEDSEHSFHGSSSSQSGKAAPKSPSRAHAQQPLVEGEAVKSTVMSFAKLSMIERTHSAPGGIPFGMLVDCHGAIGRPRRRMPESIPEDRPVVPAAAVTSAIDRPIRKVLDTTAISTEHNVTQHFALCNRQVSLSAYSCHAAKFMNHVKRCCCCLGSSTCPRQRSLWLKLAVHLCVVMP